MFRLSCGMATPLAPAASTRWCRAGVYQLGLGRFSSLIVTANALVASAPDNTTATTPAKTSLSRKFPPDPSTARLLRMVNAGGLALAPLRLRQVGGDPGAAEAALKPHDGARRYAGKAAAEAHDTC